MKANKIFIFAFIATIIFSCTNTSDKLENKNPKYVFLFIGDGMGTNQVHITELYKSAISGKIGSEKLSFSSFPVHSYMTTHSSNSNITCSAAAATAMASGSKTNNGVLNKDKSLSIEYTTIAEKAKAAGIRVGIISNVAINHATPAGFYAHQDYRKMYYEIGKELSTSKFNYFGGGSLYHQKGEKGKSEDLFQIIKDSGYYVSTTKASFDSVKPDMEYVYSVNPQLHSGYDFHWAIDSMEGSISLADFTQQGIEQLYGDEGFFIMVEGGKIDWACHKNDAASTIHEVIAFDKAVSKAIEFYNKYPDETLIIVTADHETGGIAYGKNIKHNTEDLQIRLLEYQKRSAQELHRTFNEFNSPNIPFNQVMDTITYYLGLNGSDESLSLTKEEIAWLKEAYYSEFGKGNILSPDRDYTKKDVLIMSQRAVHLLNEKAGVSWVSDDHTPMPVPIRSMGVRQEMFKSYIDNTDLPVMLEEVMGISK